MRPKTKRKTTKDKFINETVDDINIKMSEIWELAETVDCIIKEKSFLGIKNLSKKKKKIILEKLEKIKTLQKEVKDMSIKLKQ